MTEKDLLTEPPTQALTKLLSCGSGSDSDELISPLPGVHDDGSRGKIILIEPQHSTGNEQEQTGNEELEDFPETNPEFMNKTSSFLKRHVKRKSFLDEYDMRKLKEKELDDIESDEHKTESENENENDDAIGMIANAFSADSHDIPTEDPGITGNCFSDEVLKSMNNSFGGGVKSPPHGSMTISPEIKSDVGHNRFGDINL